ncbi:ribosomal protein S5, C-terminal domain-containing protein [Triangularia verruculosa]|uniref:Small ribosomal subunit protein uS5m n=1 Tax=Triangularia verruculosa TaxID=2587418 RepID=A0AAN6XNT3_9PEZI|nr:ribosomal protein S5, C-terminal domain-containing protein [Triangularia verruculosa]
MSVAARPAARRLASSVGALCSTTSTITTTTITPTTPSSQIPSSCRPFSSTPPAPGRRKPRFRNITARDLGLISPASQKPNPYVSGEQVDRFADKKFPKYTNAEKAELMRMYTPEQIAALEAGEASIDPKDLTIQGRLRTDIYRLPYIDDFAEYQPIIDKRAPASRSKKIVPPDPNARFMNTDQFVADLIEWADKFRAGEPTGTLKRLEDFVGEEWKKVKEAQWPGEVRDGAHKEFKKYLQEEINKAAKQQENGGVVSGGPTDADVLSYILERSVMTDRNAQTQSSLALALPDKVPGVAGMYKAAVDPADQGLDETGIYQDLKRRSGMSVQGILKLQTKMLVMNYVSNQTRMGKIGSVVVYTVAGNGDGWVGLGYAKSQEPTVANQKSRLDAISKMRPIRRYENRTVYGDVEAKVSGTVVKLFARPPGFGLRVQHRIFEICRAAGIYDLSARVPRSRNPMNTVKATIEALHNQKDPEEMAMGRGRKLVDARKVYYGGATQ